MSEDWLRYASEGEPWSAPTSLPPLALTRRTMVRRWSPDDGPALYEAVSESREAILPWMLWSATDHLRVEDSIFYVERARREAAKADCTDFPMGIFDRESGELLGATGLHQINRYGRSAEVGWWLRPELRGQGLCREAVGGLMGSALTPQADGGWGLRRLYAYVAVPNEASRRVCERLGMRLEGRLREERYLGHPEGRPPGWLDVLLYATLAREWDRSAGRATPEPWPHDI